jgi:hypothetical protein
LAIVPYDWKTAGGARLEPTEAQAVKRSMATAALALLAVATTSAPAFAGEVTGKGNPTPINDHRAASICSFSGLNDNPNEVSEEDPFAGGHVQSFGDIVQEAIGLLGDGHGASALVPVITSEGPGVSCRGN